MRTILACCLAFSTLPNLSYGAACLSDSLPLRQLPAMFGKPFSNLKTPYHAPCDTMVVAENTTTTLHSGTMLHFGPNSTANNVIIVEGTLITLGNEHEPVYFSGSIEEGSFGFRPSSSAWGGIVVRPTGKLKMSHTRIFNANTAVYSDSYDVTVSQVYFKGSLYLIPPWKEPIGLDFAGSTIESLDFSERQKIETSGRPQNFPEKADVKPANSRMGRTLLWGTLGAGTIIAGAGIWLWSQSDAPSPSAPNLYPTDPLLPSEPTPR